MFFYKYFHDKKGGKKVEEVISDIDEDPEDMEEEEIWNNNTK